MLKTTAALLLLAGISTQAAVTYKIPSEDGSAEGALGLTTIPVAGPGHLIWMNHFVVQAGGENIKQLQISYGCPTCNYPSPFSTPYATGVPMYIWAGTSSNPTGATLVGQTNAVVVQPGQANNSTFITMDLLTPCCLPVGTHIFVGTAVSMPPNISANLMPAAIDFHFPNAPGESWYQFGTAASIPSLATLNGTFQSLVDGNFLIRAIGEECETPEPATYALFGVALSILAAKRRRSPSRG